MQSESLRNLFPRLLNMDFISRLDEEKQNERELGRVLVQFLKFRGKMLSQDPMQFLVIPTYGGENYLFPILFLAPSIEFETK